MKARINWIDWAKAWAAATVVFCHLPQSPESFYFRYLQAVIISIFFFISGYLKRDRTEMANATQALQRLQQRSKTIYSRKNSKSAKVNQ